MRRTTAAAAESVGRSCARCAAATAAATAKASAWVGCGCRHGRSCVVGVVFGADGKALVSQLGSARGFAFFRSSEGMR